MQTGVEEKLYTISEYLALEERAKHKHEYYNGKIVKIPGGTYNHSRIANNVLVELSILLKDKNYEVLNSDVKIHIPQLESFLYPDALVVFEKPEFYAARKDVLTNPIFIVEVLSRSTGKYDRGVKFQHYKTLPSFKEYVLIEQTKPWVVSSYKIAERTWQDTEANSLAGSVYLQSVDCTIELEKVYHGAEFNQVRRYILYNCFNINLYSLLKLFTGFTTAA